MHRSNFFIELKVPINPTNMEKFYEKVKDLVAAAGRVSLASKPFGQSIAGFDQIIISQAIWSSRLVSRGQLHIKRLLVVSGDEMRISKMDTPSVENVGRLEEMKLPQAR